MPKVTSRNRGTFEENIDILFEELELAANWGRPSILIAVHKSKFGQDKAEKALESKLNKSGQDVRRVSVNNEHSDVPHLILEASSPDKSVFYVSNIDWGNGEDGKDAYRALNMYRELLVENHIRAVFWLTVNEAANLPRHAPDFWSFRHRVVEFASQRTPKNIRLPSGVMIWHVQDSIDSFDKPEQRIRVREEILAKLPQNKESLSTRIELFYNLGYLYWVLGDISKASDLLSAGLDLAADHDLPMARSQLRSGLAIIEYENEAYDKTLELYKGALQDNPEDSFLLLNLSAVCCAIGRNQEAISISKKAIKKNPADAKIWNRLGYIYSAMGKLNEALSCFSKAVQLAPNVASYHESCAIAYISVGQLDQAKSQILLARQSAGKQPDIYLDIYEQAVLAGAEKSLELLRTALNTRQISKNDARRDPNINLLFEPPQLEGLLD